MTTFGTTLTPAELQAIEDHKYFLSLERGSEVTIDEAITDFAERYASSWRRDKARRDALAQLHEIDVRRRARSAAEGREVSRAEFAIEWCNHHAAAWRSERESLESNGLFHLEFSADHTALAPVLSGSTVASIVEPFDCDVYVHGRGILRGSFVLDGRAFAHARSVRSVPALEVAKDRKLEFLATGAQASAALSALREFLAQLPLDRATP